jgi:ATP-dependent RNA helicase RhlE
MYQKSNYNSRFKSRGQKSGYPVTIGANSAASTQSQSGSGQQQQPNPASKNGAGFDSNRSNFGYRRSKGKPHSYNAQNSQRSSQNSFSGGRGKKFIKTLDTRDQSIFINKAVNISQEVAYAPHNSFNDFAIPDVLKENISRKGYTTPTPIQDKAIDPILAGNDVIGIANTGTGKTAAFLIPIINKIFRDRTKKALIIAPTRELATQIYDELRSFTRNIKVYSSLVIGGANMGRQIFEVRRGPHVVVGTPGRLKDLIQQKALYLEDYDTVVLDEVDLMVDIGFIQDVKYFISLLPKVRQSLFFSATINPKVNQILESFVQNPITVSVKQQDTSENIDQDVIKVENLSQKIEQLHDLLIKEEFKKVLVFGRTKHGVEKLHKELSNRGFKTGAIHGNKTQGHRNRVLQSFKQSEIQVLLATDVAARGLDIPLVTHVINYELPESYADYIHRIGRTGRANQKGTALTFIDPV